MSKLGINIGTIPNDGAGDSLRTGAIKINSNFDEIYNSLGEGSNITVGFGKTVISIASGSNNVGVGSTIPTEKLDVSGNVHISQNLNVVGIITADKFSGNVQGNIYSPGIVTSSSFYIANEEIISSGKELKNILSLDSITKSTIETAIALDPNDFSSLSVSGISSLGFSSPAGSGIVVGMGSTALIVNGSLLAESNSRFLETVSIDKNLEVQQNINVAGVITATTFHGDLQGNIFSATLIGLSTITANSSASAFTVTQLGTGNAVTIEDEASPDLTSFVITNSGSVGIRTAFPNYLLQVGTGHTSTVTANISGSLRADKIVGIHTLTIPVGDYGGFSPTEDAFGIPTDIIFDCLYEPSGQVNSIDYGSL